MYITLTVQYIHRPGSHRTDPLSVLSTIAGRPNSLQGGRAPVSSLPPSCLAIVVLHLSFSRTPDGRTPKSGRANTPPPAPRRPAPLVVNPPDATAAVILPAARIIAVLLRHARSTPRRMIIILAARAPVSDRSVSVATRISPRGKGPDDRHE